MARILVADDDPLVRDTMHNALVSHALGSHDVDVVADGESAIRKADEDGYDLVITDLQMPHCSGLDVLETWKRRRPGVPVIIVTGRIEEDERMRARALGVYDVLLKPLNIAQLKKLVDSALKTRSAAEQAAPGWKPPDIEVPAKSAGNPAAPTSMNANWPPKPVTPRRAPPVVRVMEKDPAKARLIEYGIQKGLCYRTSNGPGASVDIVLAGNIATIEAARNECPKAAVIALTRSNDESAVALSEDADFAIPIAHSFDPPDAIFLQIRNLARFIERMTTCPERVAEPVEAGRSPDK